MNADGDFATRAARHAALGDPTRLMIVDDLAGSDRAPGELQEIIGIASNLLAHHLEVLEQVGLITRRRSIADGRRRYVHLNRDALTTLAAGGALAPQPVLFVCTHNSARSQLAAALWEHIVGQPASSAGMRPTDRVHPGAIAAAKRAGLDLSHRRPRHVDEVVELPDLVITVCDRAHEELRSGVEWRHWSIADPVPVGTRAAFDDARDELAERITALVGQE